MEIALNVASLTKTCSEHRGERAGAFLPEKTSSPNFRKIVYVGSVRGHYLKDILSTTRSDE